MRRLKAAPYHVKKLETFRCDGVVARLNDEMFLDAHRKMPVTNE